MTEEDGETADMLRKKVFNESGQSIVEFALILPVFIAILMAVAEFGWVMYGKTKFESMVQTVVQANSKTDSIDATAFLDSYIRANYAEYDSMDLSVNVEVSTQQYDYHEYVWRQSPASYWKLPMYYDMLHTQMEASCELPYLTAFGRLLFMDSDGTLTLTARSVANRMLANDLAGPEEEDEEEDG